MSRVKLTDGTDRWFDKSKAEKYDEDTVWNGSNHISCATGNQWCHETLWRTAGGRWIVTAWSDWQGTLPIVYEISNKSAAAWLVRNNYEDHPACAEEYAVLEIK